MSLTDPWKFAVSPAVIENVSNLGGTSVPAITSPKLTFAFAFMLASAESLSTPLSAQSSVVLNTLN